MFLKTKAPVPGPLSFGDGQLSFIQLHWRRTLVRHIFFQLYLCFVPSLPRRRKDAEERKGSERCGYLNRK
jgi:hypothetical protein